MHELSISAALLEQVAAVIERHRATGVTNITLRLGPLSGVEPALLRAAYAQARVGTFAANAHLIVLDAPVRVLCDDCTAEGNGTPNRLVCPACGSANTRLLGGDEMLIEAVDLVF
jgi:hydrogenase nickel incorporation protein HypA/HybF